MNVKRDRGFVFPHDFKKSWFLNDSVNSQNLIFQYAGMRRFQRYAHGIFLFPPHAAAAGLQILHPIGIMPAVYERQRMIITPCPSFNSLRPVRTLSSTLRPVSSGCRPCADSDGIYLFLSSCIANTAARPLATSAAAQRNRWK